jgi:hypothetical protein
VTIVSRFHPNWCLVAQESKLGRKIYVLGSFLGGPDKSGTVTEQVRWTFSAATCVDCFEHILLTVSMIDYILLLLAS